MISIRFIFLHMIDEQWSLYILNLSSSVTVNDYEIIKVREGE